MKKTLHTMAFFFLFFVFAFFFVFLFFSPECFLCSGHAFSGAKKKHHSPNVQRPPWQKEEELCVVIRIVCQKFLVFFHSSTWHNYSIWLPCGAIRLVLAIELYVEETYTGIFN